MKKNIYQCSILSGALLLFALSSCSTMRKSTSTDLQVEKAVYQYPTVADLNVQPKIEKKVSWGFVPFNLGQPSMANRKSNLMADAVKESAADVLLEPQLVYTKVPFGERTLTITGFPASFTNFRNATPEDLEALKIMKEADQKEVYEVKLPWYKKIIRVFKSK